jgi:hypothetical protein
MVGPLVEGLELQALLDPIGKGTKIENLDIKI